MTFFSPISLIQRSSFSEGVCAPAAASTASVSTPFVEVAEHAGAADCEEPVFFFTSVADIAANRHSSDDEKKVRRHEGLHTAIAQQTVGTKHQRALSTLKRSFQEVRRSRLGDQNEFFEDDEDEAIHELDGLEMLDFPLSLQNHVEMVRDMLDIERKLIWLTSEIERLREYLIFISQTEIPPKLFDEMAMSVGLLPTASKALVAEALQTKEQFVCDRIYNLKGFYFRVQQAFHEIQGDDVRYAHLRNTVAQMKMCLKTSMAILSQPHVAGGASCELVLPDGVQEHECFRDALMEKCEKQRQVLERLSLLLKKPSGGVVPQ